MLTLALAACGSSDDSSTSGDAPTAAPEPGGWSPSDEDRDAGGSSGSDDGFVGDVAPPIAGEGGVGLPGFDLGSIGRQVALELRVTMTSDDLRATVDGILRSASAQGGGVASSDVFYGSVAPDGTTRPDGRAFLVVKVPPASLSTFLAGLERIGTVTALGQDAQDVTDQLTDLGVRIANAERSVERIRALLSEAANLREVIELEAELTIRQTTLERLQASERNLTERVSLSTVTIEVYPTSQEPEPEPTGDGIGDAFRDGIELFVAVVVGIVAALAYAAPFLAIALVAAIVAWIAVRRRRRSPTGATNAGGVDAVPADADSSVPVSDPARPDATDVTSSGSASPTG